MKLLWLFAAAVVAGFAQQKAPAMVVFGDSIAAGFGLEAGQSFTDLLQQDVRKRGYAYRVVNMGVSVDTTQDGLALISLAIAAKIAVDVLELAVNDVLR